MGVDDMTTKSNLILSKNGDVKHQVVTSKTNINDKSNCHGSEQEPKLVHRERGSTNSFHLHHPQKNNSGHNPNLQ